MKKKRDRSLGNTLFFLAVIAQLFVLFRDVLPNFLKFGSDSVRPDSEAGKQEHFLFPAELAPDQKVAPVEGRTAKNYYIIFDGSGSMGDRKCAGNGQKIQVAKAAVKEFSAQIPESANVGLAVFDGRGLSERIVLGKDNQAAVAQAIEKVEAAGGTPLASAISLAGHELARQAALQMGYGEYHMVVVTDGEADKGEDPQSIVNAILKESPIVVHTIGFCIGAKHSLNQAGRVLYQSADNPEELRQGLKEVLAEATTFNVDEFAKTQ